MHKLTTTRKRNSRREFSKLPPHHILCHSDLMIDLAVMHLKSQTDEIGQYRGGAGLCFYRRWLLAWLGGALYWKAEDLGVSGLFDQIVPI